MTPSTNLHLISLECTIIEEAIEDMKSQNLVAEQKEQLHQLVCRLETAATKLRNIQAAEPPAILPEIHFVNGICCEYCYWLGTKRCPIKEASDWSSRSNFCNHYSPNPAIPHAQPFSALLKPNSF